MLQAENDPKRSQGTSRAKSDSFTDFDPTQDINKDQREKSNVSVVTVAVSSNADDEVVLCSEGNVKNEQDMKPTQIIPAHENNVNADNDVSDCELAEINTNKPPESELFQDEMARQVIILGEYKNETQPVEAMPADYVPTRVKEVEGVVLNNIDNVKNTFDEAVSQFTIALQSSIRVKSEDIPNIIPTDKTDKNKPIDVADNYFDATQEIIKDQREKSNVSLVVASNADDKVVLCSDDGNVKNEQHENKNTYCGIDLPIQENIDDISANDATLINISDSSDEESTPKKSKRFTFTDSDFPDSDEIRDILMSFPKPAVVESCSESESEYSSEEESYEFLRRFRNKTKPLPKVDLTKMFEILPERVIARQRKPTFKMLSNEKVSKNSSIIFKPIYLTEEEDQIDGDIILENIKRFKSFKKAKTYKDSKNHENINTEEEETTSRKKPDNKNNEHKTKVKVKIEKPERKGRHLKTKSFARRNPKEDTLELNSVSASKTNTRTTRSMKKENDGKNTQKKWSGNKNKKPDHKLKPCGERRSQRQQKTNEKNDDTVKAPISILKKSKPKQSTLYNVTSSSSESPKSLKRSLVDDSGVPNSNRTRSHKNNNNNSVNNTSLRATLPRAVKTPHVHLSAFPGKEHKLDKQDPHVRLERYEPEQKWIRTLNSNRNYLTQSQLARKRFHRSCKRTRETRTSTKRLSE